MNERRQTWMRVTAVSLLLLMALLGVTRSAKAQSVYFGDKVSLDETIQNDAVMTGDDVMMNGVIEGDLFAVGKNVTINGTVEGSLFAVGETVIINGEVQGSSYVVAVSAQLRDGGSVQRNLYILALSMVIEEGSSIGRDLMAVTLGARLAGGGDRDTVAVIGLVEVVKWVMNTVNQITTGKSVAFLEPGITVDTRARTTSYRVRGQDGAEVTPAAGNTSVEWLLQHGRLFFSYLLVGILMLWLLPGLNEGWADKVGERPFATFGSGIVAYIVGFIGAVVLFAILLAIGVGLASLRFWGLAFTWWGITLSTLSLAFWIFILLVSFASKVVVAYWGGRWLLRRFLPKAGRRFWALLLGLAIYMLLLAIPFAGWGISLIVTFVGMGAVALVYLEMKQAGGETAVALEEE